MLVYIFYAVIGTLLGLYIGHLKKTIRNQQRTIDELMNIKT